MRRTAGSIISSKRSLQGIRETNFSLPAKTGELEKFSPATFKRWQKRDVEIRDGILKYYKVDKTKRECKGTLNFDLYKCIITIQSDERKFNLTMSGNEREFRFRAKDKADAMSWVTVIQAHIERSQGHLNQQVAPKTKLFWR